MLTKIIKSRLNTAYIKTKNLNIIKKLDDA